MAACSDESDRNSHLASVIGCNRRHRNRWLAILVVTLTIAIWAWHAFINQRRLNDLVVLAVKRHSESEVSELLDEGADANLRIGADNYNGVWSICELWLRRVRLGPHVSGRPLLSRAAADGGTSIVRLLLLHGAEVDALSEYGYTPLLTTAGTRACNPDVVNELLAHGADVNARSTSGVTALMQTTTWNNIGIARLLLSKGAKPDSLDKAGRSALMFAVDQDEPELVSLLLSSGANPSLRDTLGQTPATAAEASGYADVVKLIRNRVKNRR